MSDPKSILTKTCAICGKAQPLAAFLQLAGPQGTTYGTVCAICRSAGLDKPKKSEFEELRRDDLQLTIDAKAKLKKDQERRELATNKEESEKDQKKKETAKRSAQGAAKEKGAKEERGRRESFLDQRYRAQSPQEKPRDAMVELANREQQIDTRGKVDDTYIPKIKHQGKVTKEFKYGLLGAGSPFAQNEFKKLSDKQIVEKSLGPPNKTRGR